MNSRLNYREKPVEEWGMPEWEEFFVALQKEMPKEKIELINGPSSGELIAQWPEMKFQGYASDVRKEIRYHENDGSHFFAFTLIFWNRDTHQHWDWDVHESAKKRAYDALCECLKQSAWGDVLEKPEKFSIEEEYGTFREVYCQTKTQDCWLAKNADGRLNMAGTVENLRKAEEILQAAYQKHLRDAWDAR